MIIQPQNFILITLIFQQKFTVSKGQYTLQNDMVDYTSWLIILPNMKAIVPTTSEDFILKMHEKFNSYKNSWINIAR